jgi:hypothetical protein
MTLSGHVVATPVVAEPFGMVGTRPYHFLAYFLS